MAQRWGAIGIFDSSQRTKDLQTRSIFSDALAQRTAIDKAGRPFMNLQSASVGQGGPVNTVSIAADTGAMNLSQAEFDAIVASETPEPAAVYLPAPTYDFVNTGFDGSILTIAWNPVPGATHYKVCMRDTAYNNRLRSTYINQDTTTIVLGPPVNSTQYPFFTSDSGPITATTYSISIDPVGYYSNFYVFAYNNLRGEFPSTQLFIQYKGPPSQTGLYFEIWEVSVTLYDTPFDNTSTTKMVTFRNLNTKASITETMKYVFDNQTEIPVSRLSQKVVLIS